MSCDFARLEAELDAANRGLEAAADIQDVMRTLLDLTNKTIAGQASEIAALKDKYGDLENKSCAEIGRLNAEIAALKVENAELEALCDKTYVAQGADAYDHACEVLEAWQEKRIALGRAPGCVGSLCGGMEWLYAQVSGQESEIAALKAESAALRNAQFADLRQDAALR